MTATRPNRGFHPTLEQDHPYVFVDACIQAWPDADWSTAHRHGVTAYGVTAWMPHSPFETVIESVMGWHLVARQNPRVHVAFTVDDIRRAKANGDTTLLLASQDGDFIGTKLHRVEALYRLGLRMTLLAYNQTNHLCDGVLDRTDAGLTRLGQLVVKECNRVGMVLDCSHVGRRASLEIIEQSEDPVVFSHANPSALSENPRNIDDEQIRACVERGGVIGLVNWGPLTQKTGQTTRPTVEDFIDHVDYVVQLTGSTRHVGLGTDMSLGSYPPHGHDAWGDPGYPNTMARYNRIENMPTTPLSPMRFTEGFDSFSDVPRLIERLEARGYSGEDIAGLLGENFLRVFERVWKPI